MSQAKHDRENGGSVASDVAETIFETGASMVTESYLGPVGGSSLCSCAHHFSPREDLYHLLRKPKPSRSHRLNRKYADSPPNRSVILL